MARKTPEERDAVNTRIRINAARTREERTAIVLEWVEAYGTAPEWLWKSYGFAEWNRGWHDAITDITEG